MTKHREAPCCEADVVAQAFYGSNPGRTRSVLSRLAKCGPPGLLAAACFRAQKASKTGKRRYGRYTREYSGYAYARKRDQLQAVASILAGHPSLGLVWGWGDDDGNNCAPHVLYVDLPVGQVSWHAEFRGAQEYPGEWDGQHRSEQRIIRYCEMTLVDVPEIPRRSGRISVRAGPKTVQAGPKIVQAVPVSDAERRQGERRSG